MGYHKIERKAPAFIRIPKNVPVPPKFRTIVADCPWTKNHTSRDGRYGSAINHYPLMSLQRIKDMPVANLSAEDAHLYLWVINGNVDEGLEVIRAWDFRYITMIHWIKPRPGQGNYYRGASETCLFAVRGKLPPKCRNQINWMISTPTVHSEKPRGFISNMVERVSPGPYLELFCRRRPASSEKWYCWGNETEGGADIFIPGYPVPKYSFEDCSDACDAPQDKDLPSGKETEKEAA